MKKLDFSAVFKEYYPLVRAYCLSRFGIDGYDADDYVSQAFSDLWLKWEDFSSASPPAVYSWLCKRARSIFIDEYRRKKRAPDEVEYNEELHGIAEIDGVLEDEAYQAYIAEIRSKLGERENEIFTAMVEQSLGIDKTAEILGMNRAGTLTAWYRLRTKLGEILKNIF
ncbi:MAG: sigma-70 family RNA polymerase sigma factor [Clostridia bacterium]|nr:sigma-70 family RNA polymerase sigma factor [Clostridia bacterium]